MGEYRNPKKKTIPAWYEIGQRAGEVFILRIHREMTFEHDLKKSRLAKDYGKRFRIGEFEHPSPAGFGFREQFKKVSSPDPNWNVYEAALPNLRADNSDDLALRASLSVIFNSLSLYEGTTTSPLPQLIVSEGLRIELGPHGSALAATLTPAVCQWLHMQPDNSELVSVVDTMMKADDCLWPNKRVSVRRHEFQARCGQPKWLHLQVPGNACGLDPDDYFNESPDVGYQLSPHNVDFALQQLTFLMGLARLHDLVRGR